MVYLTFFKDLSEHRNGVLGEFNQSKKKAVARAAVAKGSILLCVFCPQYILVDS